jgi:predicted nuclease of restriction endonuclease-like (RecB) superfamily
MAEQILKDPYNFDFLTVTAQEREIERGLLTHLRDLLLELGRGFPFVGSQVPVTVDEQTSTSICSSTMSACTDISSSS